MNRRGLSDLSGILIVALLLGAGYYYFYMTPAGNTLVSVDLTLNYEDGSSDTYTLNTPILGQAVINPGTGKVLNNLAWVVKATPSWTGNAASLTITGSNDLFVKVGTATPVFKQSNPINFSTSSGLGTLGQATFTVKSGTLYASTLEGWSPSTGSKTLNFEVTCQAVLTMADAGLPASTKTAGSTLAFNYNVQADGLTGLSISITNTPN